MLRLEITGSQVFRYLIQYGFGVFSTLGDAGHLKRGRRDHQQYESGYPFHTVKAGYLVGIAT
jgi:hypothetical protein